MSALLPELIAFPKHVDDNGMLCVYESPQHVPFSIRRVFMVTARPGESRGDHAHRQCTQLLVCVAGAIRVTCDSGTALTRYVLDSMAMGLVVPPGTWASEEYLLDGTVLMVLCDRGYEAEDYIHSYGEFRQFLSERRSPVRHRQVDR